MTLPRKIKTTTKTGRFHHSIPKRFQYSIPNGIRVPRLVVWVVTEYGYYGRHVWVATSKNIAEDIAIQIIKNHARSRPNDPLSKKILRLIREYTSGLCSIETVLRNWRDLDGYIDTIRIQSSKLETQLQKEVRRVT